MCSQSLYLLLYLLGAAVHRSSQHSLQDQRPLVLSLNRYKGDQLFEVLALGCRKDLTRNIIETILFDAKNLWDDVFGVYPDSCLLESDDVMVDILEVRVNHYLIEAFAIWFR